MFHLHRVGGRLLHVSWMAFTAERRRPHATFFIKDPGYPSAVLLQKGGVLLSLGVEE